MRILVIGGSNSLMGEGYLERAVQVLERQVETLSVTNLSVGGTTSYTGIARVFDLPPDAAFDVVVYEYALNDALALDPHRIGPEAVFLAVQLLVGVLASRFPQALFVPVSLAMRRYFSAAVRSPVHDLLTAVWRAMGNAHLDVRGILSQLFVGQSPEWLYSDEFHYCRPQGADIVGSLLARCILETLDSGSYQTLSALDAKIRARPEAKPFGVRHLSAEKLAERATGDWSLEPRENSIMSTPVLRLRLGAGVRFEERPLNLAMLSDRQHGYVRLARGEGERERLWRLCTRFIAVDQPALNPPPMDRFFYSGLPLPLLLQTAPVFRSDPEPYRITVEPDRLEGLPPLWFFNFSREIRPRAEEQRLDLVSALFLTPA